MTASLSEFLLARIAEDERRSHAAALDDDWVNDEMPLDGWYLGPRVLGECAVKQALIELHRTDREHYCPTPDGSEYFNREGEAPQDCPTLRWLGSLYANHPDFDVSWSLGGLS